MNNKQLTVLWYVVVLAIVVLCDEGYRLSIPWPYAGALLLLAGMLIYTFRPHPTCKRRWLLLSVLLPTLLISSTSCWLYVHYEFRPSPPPIRAANDKFSQVLPMLVTIYDAKMENYGQVSAWARNDSNVHVRAIDLLLTIYNERGDVIGTDTQTVLCDIAPKQAARIEVWTQSNPLSLKVGWDQRWSWRFEVQAVGSEDTPPPKQRPKTQSRELI